MAPAGLDHQALVEDMIAYWRGKLAQVLPDRPDFIVLPEVCDLYRGHSYAERMEYSRVRGDRVLDALREVAREHRCYITYPSTREMSDGTWRNSVTLLDRDGETLGCYDKNHVVIEETTEAGILCGEEAPVIECDFGRIAFAICFDLNFDALRGKYAAAQPDLIVFPSMYHGGLMQAYWAYSCRAHFVGCISDPVCPSSILSPVGHEIASTTNHYDYVTATINLDCRLAHLDGNEEKLAALKNKYGLGVTVFDPGRLAVVLLTSESEETTIDEMVREFEIEQADEYFARSLAHQCDPKNIGSSEVQIKVLSRQGLPI
jgi:predicted amidohydrolase